MTLKSSRDDFNVLDNFNVSGIKTAIKAKTAGVNRKVKFYPISCLNWSNYYISRCHHVKLYLFSYLYLSKIATFRRKTVCLIHEKSQKSVTNTYQETFTVSNFLKELAFHNFFFIVPIIFTVSQASP